MFDGTARKQSSSVLWALKHYYHELKTLVQMFVNIQLNSYMDTVKATNLIAAISRSHLILQIFFYI